MSLSIESSSWLLPHVPSRLHPVYYTYRRHLYGVPILTFFFIIWLPLIRRWRIMKLNLVFFSWAMCWAVCVGCKFSPQYYWWMSRVLDGGRWSDIALYSLRPRYCFSILFWLWRLSHLNQLADEVDQKGKGQDPIEKSRLDSHERKHTIGSSVLRKSNQNHRGLGFDLFGLMGTTDSPFLLPLVNELR